MEVIKEQNDWRGALYQINKRFGTLGARMRSMENRIVSVENRMSSPDARLTDTYARLSKDIRDNFK